MSPCQSLNSIQQTCERLRIGRTTLYQLIAEGRLQSLKIGSRRLISDEAINRLIAELESLTDTE